MEIKGSVVLITGAAERVGRAVALYLAERGAHIVFSYYDAKEDWENTLAEINALGVSGLAVQTEVRDSKQVHRLVEAAIQQHGRIDVLINNASVWLRSPMLEITEEEWDAALDINLKGPFLMTQAVAPHMIKQEQGVIINMTDLSAFQIWPGYVHHGASKAGLVSLTRSMAYELSPHIRVNAIAPGTVLLPDNAPPEKRQWAIEMSTLKRVGTPTDVARLAAYLIESDFVTGSVNFVDGGRSLV
jgi:NAD(P)-dependent dehydrogenase (short-subunit alcohol dehydrogenase family)